jgi:hypothetical protein
LTGNDDWARQSKQDESYGRKREDTGHDERGCDAGLTMDWCITFLLHQNRVSVAADRGIHVKPCRVSASNSSRGTSFVDNSYINSAQEVPRPGHPAVPGDAGRFIYFPLDKKYSLRSERATSDRWGIYLPYKDFRGL